MKQYEQESDFMLTTNYYEKNNLVIVSFKYTKSLLVFVTKMVKGIFDLLKYLFD